ncbi:MAG: signal transduction histidine kinase, partial [Myxococcota bacterium]
PPDTRPMLQRLLEASVDLPGLLELWAAASCGSREPPQWVGLSAAGEPTLGGAERAVAHAAPGGPPQPIRDGCWLTSHAIDNDGVLIATFHSEVAARAGWTALERLTADLSLGLRLLRRSSDNNALIELSRVLAEVTEPRPALVRVAEIIAEQLSADGVSVYLMVTQGKALHLEQVLQTGERRAAPQRVLVSSRRGLVDWVLRTGDWLLLPRAGARGERAAVKTGAHGTVTLQPRPQSDYWGRRASEPRICTQLLVPLHRQGQVVGVLGVWRTSNDPFDAVLDLETMQHLAPHVTNACVRVRGTERIKAELKSTQRLAAALRPDLRPATVRRRVLEEVCALTGWPRAVMFLHDPRQRSQLYFAASWATARGDKPDATSLQELVLDAGEHRVGWPAMLVSRLHRHFEASVPMQAALLQGRHEQPRGVVVLVGLGDGPAELPLTPQLDTLVLGSFLRYAGALLDNHSQAFADATGEHIERARGAPQTLEEALTATADYLSRAIGADLVIVDEHRGRQIVTRAASPPAPPPLQIGASRPTVRWDAPPLGKTTRILDVTDRTDPGLGAVSPEQLATLQEGYGWSGVRSWVGAPIQTDGRTLGLIQALTSRSGPSLGADEAAIVEAAAAWAGAAMAAGLRRQMLEELNTLAHELAGLTGEALGQGAVAALEGWLERHLGRRCHVALLAWTPPRHPLLITHSDRLDVALIETLRELSIEWGPQSMRWGARARLGEAGTPISRAGLAAPLRLPGEPALRGHLVVLHRSPFSPADARLLSEAARELANLLHGELIQQEWRFQIGLFRHALLGPVQGLSSAALRLGMLARDPEPDSRAEVVRLEGRIREETEIIRLWRDTQRTFAMLRDGAPLELRPRNGPLRPLLERCLARYQPAFAARGITATLSWPSSGALRFDFDRVAVDLAVSNLLDNARKYAFYNRTVVLGARVERAMIAIWVEDIGAEIPPALGEAIYDLRKRTDRQDPIRAIQGEGLGLFITRAVAHAHNGELSHSCTLKGVSAPSAPHRVRFTLWLPHHWRKG